MHKDFDGFCANSAKAIEKIFIRRFPSETSRPREKHNGKSLRQSCSPHKNKLQKNPAAKQRDFEMTIYRIFQCRLYIHQRRFRQYYLFVRILFCFRFR